ncbi:MAG: hypothetical protein LUF87_00510 [Alistipes sp.]|nr:hypothetical protein [Alistipes sp.]
MTGSYKWAVTAMFLLAGVHSLLSFTVYPGFGREFFWFLGTGLALCYLGAINLINLAHPRGIAAKTAVAANLLCLVFALVLAVRFRHIPAALAALDSAFLMYCSARTVR